MPLLLTYNNAAGNNAPGAAPQADYALMDAADQVQAMEKLTAQARLHFNQRAAYVQDIAQQKQEVLKQLVEMTPIRPLSAQDPQDPVHHFYLVDAADEDTIILWATMNKETMSAAPQVWEGEISLKKCSAPGLKANSYAVIQNKDLGGDVLLTELMHALSRVCEENAPQDAPHPAHAAPPAKPAP
jgi:hypothetical protein